MALFVYTRHANDCKYKEDLKSKRCRCPKWIDGALNGQRLRQSAGTRSWDKAEEKRRDLENQADDLARRIQNGLELPLEKGVTVTDAVQRFLTAKRKEGLRNSTMVKLELLCEKRLAPWSEKEGITFLAQVNAQKLDEFRNTLHCSPLTLKIMQQQLSGFFGYCVRMDWILKNPVKLLGRIKVKNKPTDYFPRDEFEKLMDATYVYNPKHWTDCRNQPERLRIFMLLMRWSGLGIRDAACLERTRLNENDELFLYRAKTGTAVYVPLPPDVAHTLRTVPPGPKPNPAYFFWTGNGDRRTTVRGWQRSFRRLFKIANLKHDDGSVKRCHPHMFRDTFAVELLLAGAKLEEVSLLLGHHSIRTTEKHYAPFVKARREQLATTVRQAWTAQRKVMTMAGVKRRAARA